MQRRTFLSLMAVSAVLGGCSSLKKLTGQRNDKVLPGQREDVLSPDQYTAKNTEAPGQTPPDLPPADPAATCDPEVNPDCVPAIDQEGAGAGGQ